MMRDFIHMADHLDRHDAEIGRAAFVADQRASTFFCAVDLDGRSVPNRDWLVEDLAPTETVTLLTGDGGTGKSLLALQLAVAVASGSAWVGRKVDQGRVVYITAEDDADELHRRLVAVCRSADLRIADLDGLTLRSLAGEDALLANLHHNGALTETPFFHELDDYLASVQPSLLVLDTLADLFPGNENDRAQARHFVGLLRGLALRHRCAVLLLSHPSLTGLNSGSGTSGSTAWSNSVRSRLYLSRVKDEAYEANPDARVLSTKKSNYGPVGQEVSLTWTDGAFVADAAETGLDRMAVNAKAERVFLKLLGLLREQGRNVSPNPSNSFAPAVFAKHPDAEGITKHAFAGAMEALLSSGKITIGVHGRGGSKKQHLEIGATNV